MTELLPWSKIVQPNAGVMYAALRVDPDNAFDFFWGVDVKSRRLLILKHNYEKVNERPLPKLEEIEVVNNQNVDGTGYLIWALEGERHEAIFHKLCLDITKAASQCNTEENAIRQSLERTRQWQRMMRGISILSRESQMGLIGELLFMERYLLNHFDAEQAVKSWVGPFGSHVDFELGNFKVECKTRSSGTAHEVIVNSELQLELNANFELMLCVYELMEADGHLESFTVPDLAERVRSKIGHLNSLAQELFEERLNLAGLVPKDDYSSFNWMECDEELYRVNNAFPKLVPTEIPNGISKVIYSVNLDFCNEFRTTNIEFQEYLVRR